MIVTVTAGAGPKFNTLCSVMSFIRKSDENGVKGFFSMLLCLFSNDVFMEDVMLSYLFL